MKLKPTAIFSTLGLVIMFLFQGVGTKYLPDDLSALFSWSNQEEPLQESVATTKQGNDVVLTTLIPKTPVATDKTAILDNNLYVYKHFGELRIGGVNFELVKLSARAKNGDLARVESRGETFLSYAIYDMPYIELSYKDDYYAIEITPEYFTGTDTDISLYFSLMKIREPSMVLKEPSRI